MILVLLLLPLLAGLVAFVLPRPALRRGLLLVTAAGARGVDGRLLEMAAGARRRAAGSRWTRRGC